MRSYANGILESASCKYGDSKEDAVVWITQQDYQL